MSRLGKQLVKKIRMIITVIGLLSLLSVQVSADTSLEVELRQLIQNHYKGDIEEALLFEADVDGMIELLDRYSGYYEKEQVKALTEINYNNYVGIGAKIKRHEKGVIIEAILEEYPADIAGVLVGDVILEVDDVPIIDKDLETIMSLIKGFEGSEVTLSLQRDGEVINVAIIRDQIVGMNDLKYKSVSEEIGYIQISKFNYGIAEAFNKVLEQATLDHKESLIIDLRNNGGGLLNEVVAMCKQVIPSGPIVHIIDQQGYKQVYESTLQEAPFELVVLVNQSSASASEIFASAVSESGAGIVIGQTTFGKGMVQKVFKLSSGDYFKLTTAEYLTRDYQSIDGVGLEPEIIVDLPIYIENISEKYTVGCQSEKVKLIETMLVELEYRIDDVDNVYTEQTKEVIKNFQKSQGLYAYGVCDLTTQKALNYAVFLNRGQSDLVFERAVNYLIKLF